MSDQKQAYYQEFVKHLAMQIMPSDEIKSFVGNNSTLIGDLAEAQVRKFIRQIVFPLRVSHGAIIAPESYGGVHRAKQVDTIIWTPNPLPPLLEVDNFVLIHRTSSMGILEIKSSAYSGVGEAIDTVLKKEYDLTEGQEPPKKRLIPAALGVIVLQREPITDSKLRELIADDKVVVLLLQDGDKYQPNTDAMLKLVNHLAGVRKRALLLGDLRINTDDYNAFESTETTLSSRR